MAWRRGRAVGLLLAVLAGCGSSDSARELPEAAKQALVRKKVDAQPRPAPGKRPRG